MNQLERDLHESLKRRDAPAGFADKVIARTRRADRRSPVYRWMAAVALVVVLVGGTMFYREQQRQQAEAEKAKEDLLFALRLTGSRLQVVQARLSAIQRTIQLPSEQ